MLAAAGYPSHAGHALNWSRLFALQPEPDLEFTEEELEQATPVRSTSPMKRPKKSGGRPLLWLLLLVLAAGIGYVAMDPQIISDVLAPLLGEEPLPPLPSASVKPAPVPPAPAAPPAAGTTATPPPSPASPVPSSPVPTAAAPMAPLKAAPPIPAPASAPVTASPVPMFGEGQKVTVSLDPATPGETVALSLDPAGTKPGPAVRPGTTLTVLDGDLQATGWVYSVRSDDGTKGWIPERRLRLKP